MTASAVARDQCKRAGVQRGIADERLEPGATGPGAGLFTIERSAHAAVGKVVPRPGRITRSCSRQTGRAILRIVSKGPETPKADWVRDLPSGPPHKVLFANLADLNHAHEGFAEYEAAADPDRMRLETMQRRYRGQYLRHVRRILSRARHRRSEAMS